MPAPVTLFGLERSVYTRIARLALEEKGVPYTLDEVDVFASTGVPNEHLSRHPFGRIPVLQHGEQTVFETDAITRYVDEAFAGPALQPGLPAERARMNQAIGILDSYAYQPMVWGVFVRRVRIPLNGGTVDEGKIAASLAQAATCLTALSRLLGAGPWFAGDQVSLADLHAYPMFCYFALTPEGSELLAGHAGLHRWYCTMGSRRSVVLTRTKYEPVS